MLTGRPAELLAELRRALPRWNCTLDGNRVTLTYGNATHAYHPPRRTPSWSDLITSLTDACAAHGIQRGRLLPLQGLCDAELTFSAVQALDPYLKRREHHVHARGFIPQPVVRFTGQRDEHGALLPGFSSSFVNISIVEPIDSVHEHAALIDTWLGALSRLGFHTKHLTISGSMTVWRRAEVAGITLHLHHEHLELGDAVLLWNHHDPSKLATDIGSGLERLAWLLTRRTWANVVYGNVANHADIRHLDALRTATLIVGNGLRPTPRGPGSTVRRILRHQTQHNNASGVSRIVRWAHAYWSQIRPLPVPWPDVCHILDTETLDHPARGNEPHSN